MLYETCGGLFGLIAGRIMGFMEEGCVWVIFIGFVCMEMDIYAAVLSVYELFYMISALNFTVNIHFQPILQ